MQNLPNSPAKGLAEVCASVRKCAESVRKCAQVWGKCAQVCASVGKHAACMTVLFCVFVGVLFLHFCCVFFRFSVFVLHCFLSFVVFCLFLLFLCFLSFLLRFCAFLMFPADFAVLMIVHSSFIDCCRVVCVLFASLLLQVAETSMRL